MEPMKFGDTVYWASEYLGPVRDVFIFSGRVIAFDDWEVFVMPQASGGGFFGPPPPRFMRRDAVFSTEAEARAAFAAAPAPPASSPAP
jgi:hypothetical protein